MDGRNSDFSSKPSNQKKMAENSKTRQLEDVTKLLAKIKRGGPETQKYKLKDGGYLVVVKTGRDVNYHMKMLDGRQIFLERTSTHLGLIVADKTGTVIRSLGCEL